MAGLPGSSATVCIGPPLYARGPSSAATPTRLPLAWVKPPALDASSIRLLLPETVPAISPPDGLPATMVLLSVAVLVGKRLTLSSAPPLEAELSARVQSVSVTEPPSLQ